MFRLGGFFRLGLGGFLQEGGFGRSGLVCRRGFAGGGFGRRGVLVGGGVCPEGFFPVPIDNNGSYTKY